MASAGFAIRARIKYNNLPKIGKAYRDRVAELAQEAADAIKYDAKAAAPYDTGDLQASIEAQPVAGRRLQWEVIVGVDYGHYVEYGTIKSEAQPFLLPAWEEHSREFERKVAAMLAEVGRKYSR